jgi:glutamate formiminotransferase/formiminotetrahydrofolate cyclodeaminase
VQSLSFETLLEQLARGTPTPGAGSAAALVTAAAAALTAMAARSSRGSWSEAAAAVAQAESLRARATALAQENADALEAFLAERAPNPAQPTETRDFRLGRALLRAADVPLLIAETACDVTLLAAHVASRCNGDVRPDAASAALLAQGAAAAAAHLVEVNLATAPDDARVVRARQVVRTADRAAGQALDGDES